LCYKKWSAIIHDAKEGVIKNHFNFMGEEFMCKKTCLLISLILVGVLVGNCWAVTWSGGGAPDRSWTNPANWGGSKPSLTVYAYIMTACDVNNGPLVWSGSPDANAQYVKVGGTSGGSVFGTLKIQDGGRLDVAQYMYVGWDSSSVRSGELYMTGGTLNLGYVTPASGNLTVAARYTGTWGIVRMYGGVINVPATFLIANESGTTGKVYLYGGTINAHVFGIGAGSASMDITAGKLVVDGNVVADIDDLVTGGVITAYDGDGDVIVDYNSVSGKTTVTGYLATPEAKNPSPIDGATGVGLDETLSWTAGQGATSHDVYFGTANPPPFIGNQPETTFDPGTLDASTTYYWQIDEVSGSGTTTGNLWHFTTFTPLSGTLKGPYMIYPGNNTEMTVLWQMPSTVSCTVSWGTDTSRSTGSVGTTEQDPNHIHKCTITGLTPGTKYYYRVTTPTGWDNGSFLAAPASDATAVKFIAYGDTRTNYAMHDIVCARMISTYTADPGYQSIVLHVGDWVEADNEATWIGQWFRGDSSVANIYTVLRNVPYNGCRGNHEGSGVVWSKYWQYPFVAAKYWSFDYGPAHIAIVDQYTPYTTDTPQNIWLKNDLASTTKKWKFIVLHQPGWCAGGQHGNDGNVQLYIQPLCEKYGVQIVFAGHNHYYSRAAVRGVQHVTTGAGGAPFYTISVGQPYVAVAVANTLEFCKVSINGDTLKLEAIDATTGATIDSFYMDEGNPDLMFVQPTDPQMNMCPTSPSYWVTTVNKINNVIEPNFVIDTGDLVNSQGSNAEATTYLSIAANLKPGIELYNVPGNHDVHDAPTPTSYAWYQSWFGYIPSNTYPWYSFTRGNCIFIVLESGVLRDSSQYPGADAAEIAWLTTTLQNSGAYTHKYVFMHHPLCISSVTEPNNPSWTIPFPMRTTLLNLFHTYGVNAVFSGHLHYNAYTRDGDLEIISTSSCTCPLRNDPPLLCEVKVYSDHTDWEWRLIDDIIQPYLAGDFDLNGKVDMQDCVVIMSGWLENGVWP
jgi:hypothetical protein